MTPIYLDHAASTPLLPEAWEAMRVVSAEAFGNPSSAHAMGRKTRQHLETARERVAELLGATPDEVIFTSGATEANNLAVFGLALLSPAGRGVGGEGVGSILAAPLEHPCVIEPLKQLAVAGFVVDWLPVTSHGTVEQKAVIVRATDQTRLVSLMLVNHETGVVQPVRHVAKTLPKHVLMHTDAAQAVGKMPVNFADLGVTALTASAHKFGGPKGVGLLLLKKGAKLRPQVFGGHQQRGHRPGTEAVPLAVGLATALEVAVRQMEANAAKVKELRERFLARLLSSSQAGEGLGVRGSATINSPPDALPYILNVSFPGCRSEVLLMALDLAGVACSTGSACSSGSLLPSPVLQAMGVPDDVLHSAMRFSFAPTLTEEKVDEAAERVLKCVERTRQMSN
jgi:cysteine desulfurase